MNEKKTCLNCELMLLSPFKPPCWECVNTVGSAPGWRPDKKYTKKTKKRDR